MLLNPDTNKHYFPDETFKIFVKKMTAAGIRNPLRKIANTEKDIIEYALNNPKDSAEKAAHVFKQQGEKQKMSKGVIGRTIRSVSHFTARIRLVSAKNLLNWGL